MATVHVGDFEWDDGKAKANLEKHDVSFEEAMTVFLDQLALPLQDAAAPDRLILIGESSLNRILLVVFAEKIGAIIRIISARRATRRERKAYEED